MSKGPLSGVKIVEFAGIGPGPFCCMLLSDLGADIVRIDRKNNARVVYKESRHDIAARGRRSIALDLKRPEAVEAALQLASRADAIVEGYRPGVMEKLGLGPDVMLARNAKLVYGRMTGWGQEGPLAYAGGHDVNYIAISGALAAFGPPERPIPPINLVGDYGGGALYLAFGLLSGVIHARATGQGQVVDVAMSDGAASLMGTCYGRYAAGNWTLDRNANSLDGGAPNYGVYETADGKWISLAASEQHFYENFLRLTGLGADPEFAHQRDRAHWAALKAKVAACFKTKTRDEWSAIMEGEDACYAPVLDLTEAPSHPHNVARNAFVTVDGVLQPAPAPRFSVTPGEIQRPPPKAGEHTDSALQSWGFSAAEIEHLRTAEAI